jgi:outer membrane immunogenic protein
MQGSKARFWVRYAALAAIGTFAVISQAQAADLGYAAPAPVETWTGFSVGIGGGVGTLNADMNSNAARTDTIGLCLIDCDLLSFDLLDVNQNYSSSLSDLGGTGGFFTVQGAYDYQFAPRWVAGGFVDADWSGISGHARQSSTSSLTLLPGGDIPDEVDIDDDLADALNSISGFNVPLGRATIDSKVSTDWSVSVGGRFGWLATPSTLLYVLGAYTHQELGDARVNVRIADPLGPLSEIGLDINSPTNLVVKLPDSLDGFSLGGGSEVKIGGPWTLKVEYRWTHLQGSSARASSNDNQCCIAIGPVGIFRDVNSTASADLDLDVQTVRGALTYHFWSGGNGYGG